MLENKSNALVAQNNTPQFLADATSSLEKMEGYANMLIKSGLVPKHFYELDNYRNPVKGADGQFKGNTAAVIMTIQHGMELGMSITQSLQQIVPVNGLMSLRGDAAKALIMRSGLCKSWVEEEIGQQGSDTYGTKITSTRTDGQTISRSFTVLDAKRAGLWIDDAAVQKNEKLRHSPWFKYQSRMLRYRALGFISRDLYGDVLQNMYTEDEARDIEIDNTTIISPEGMTIKINEEKPEKLNSDAKEALLAGTPSAVKPPRKPAKAVEEPKVQEPLFTEAEVVEEPKEEPATNEEPQPHKYTKAELDNMNAKDVLNVVYGILTEEGATKLFENNKEKRVVGWLKKIVLAHQDSTLEQLIEKEFGMKLSDLKPSEKLPIETKEEESVSETPKSESEYTIAEPGESGRDFALLLELDKKQKELGISNDDILAFISENQLEFLGVEQFFRFAPSEVIIIAFGL